MIVMAGETGVEDMAARTLVRVNIMKVTVTAEVMSDAMLWIKHR